MFIIIYYCVAFISILSIPFLTIGKELRNSLSILPLTLIILCLFISSNRISGFDYDVYEQIFYDSAKAYMMPDIGFVLINRVYNFFNLPISFLIFSSFILNLIGIIRYCKTLKIQWCIVLIIFYLHFFVPREFAQFRSSMAFGVMLIGITSKNQYIKYSILLFAASIHLIILPLLIAYAASKKIIYFKNFKIKLISILLIILLIIIAGIFIQYLSFIDERITIYFNYAKAGYGLPVSRNTGLVSYTLLLLLICIIGKDYYKDKEFQHLVLIYSLGLVIYFAFYNFGIVATRLSSMFFSFYPFLVIYVLTNKDTEMNISLKRTMFILVPLTIILLLRPGSYRIISAIGL